MFDTLEFLNLQYFKRDSYISVICQALIAQGKAEAPVAVTHLALARSQKMGGGILGDTKDKETIRKGCLFIFCKKTSWER